MSKKKITKDNLLMFIQMTILGLKTNPNYPGLASELEKLFDETFEQKLIDF